MGFIYMITCLGNGHRYIGSTTDPERRWSHHVSRLRAGKAPRLMQQACDLYGMRFEFDVLIEVPDKIMVATEYATIRRMNPEFNVTRYDPEVRDRRVYLVGDEWLSMREITGRFPPHVAHRVKRGERGKSVLRPKDAKK